MMRTLMGGAVALSIFAGSALAEAKELAGWNIRYEAPAGYPSVRSIGVLELYASQADGAYLLVGPGVDRDPREALGDVSRLLSSLNLAGALTEQPTFTKLGQLDTMVATGVLQSQMGQQFRARLVVVTTPHGTTLRILAVCAPDKLDRVAKTVEAVAASVKAEAPEVNRQAVQALAGTWGIDEGSFRQSYGGSGTTHGNSHQESVTFDGQGQYRYSSSSAVYVPNMPSDIDPTSSQSDAGTYTVIGSSLVLRGSQGTMVLDLELRDGAIVAGGKAYRRQ